RMEEEQETGHDEGDQTHRGEREESTIPHGAPSSGYRGLRRSLALTHEMPEHEKPNGRPGRVNFEAACPAGRPLRSPEDAADGSNMNDREGEAPRKPEPDLESTALLLSRIREGSNEARERLFARVVPTLQRWAHRRLPER